MVLTPGYCSRVKLTSFSTFGKVRGSLPVGFTFPVRTSAMALPTSRPGMNMVRTALTSFAKGSSAAPGRARTMSEGAARVRGRKRVQRNKMSTRKVATRTALLFAGRQRQRHGPTDRRMDERTDGTDGRRTWSEGDNDGLALGLLCDGVHELELVHRKGEICSVAPLGGRGAHKHDGDVRRGSQLGGRGRVVAVVVGDADTAVMTVAVPRDEAGVGRVVATPFMQPAPLRCRGDKRRKRRGANHRNLSEPGPGCSGGREDGGTRRGITRG